MDVRQGWACLVVAATLGCGSGAADDPRVPTGPEGTWWDGRFPAGCAGTAGEDAYLCAEQLFWQSLQFEPERRAEVHASIAELTTALDGDGSLDDERLAVLYWRKVQLATAVVSENADSSLTASVFDDLARARALAPDRLEIESWDSTFNLIRSWGSGDADRLAAAETALWLTYDRDPDYVLFAAMGTASALPLDTGIPQKIADAIERFDCATHDWCERETPWVPYQQAGAQLLFGEIYARVGDRERALQRFQAALDAPRADTWPFARLAEDSRDNIDAVIGKFAERGDDQPVLDLMEQNGRATCLPCHGRPTGYAPEL